MLYIQNFNKVNGMGNLTAFFTATVSVKDLGKVWLKDLKLMNGSNGMFVSMPSKKDKDNEYVDSILMNKPVREKLLDLALIEMSKLDSTPKETNPTLPTEEKGKDDDEFPF